MAQAYKIIARNSVTGQRVQHQLLDGNLLTNESDAQEFANQLAAKMTARTRESWLGEIELFTVGLNVRR